MGDCSVSIACPPTSEKTPDRQASVVFDDFKLKKTTHNHAINFQKAYNFWQFIENPQQSQSHDKPNNLKSTTKHAYIRELGDILSEHNL